MVSLVAKYQPKAIADFIGIAEPKAALGALARQPYASAWLLTGPPGLGKTTVAQALFEHLGGQYQHIPARMCDLETVTRVCDSCQCAPMFGGPAGFNLVLADEIDKASDRGANRVVIEPRFNAVSRTDDIYFYQQ